MAVSAGGYPSSTRPVRPAPLACLALAVLAMLGGSCRPAPPAEGPRRLVASVTREPRSLNRFVSPRPAENLIALLTQASLVRVNRATGDLEPRLARAWTVSPDGLVYTFALREGVSFSDGAPFTAADVVFTFEALYDAKVASPMASSFEVNGRPLVARAIDDRTVELKFPSPFGPGLTILDSLPILPRHKLAAALAAGTFAGVWNVKTPVTEVVGLGPFVLAEYVPGQRLRFTRNARFWKAPLPALDEIELQIIPEQDAEILRLQSGQIDAMSAFARAEDLAGLRQAAATGAVRLVDAGVDIVANALWFDLGPNAPHAKTRPWLQREELRKAISYAADRQAIVDTVYLGAAVPLYGPITPGHGEWYAADLPAPPRDLAKARALLSSIGLIDRNGDGTVEDTRGTPARFTILTHKGNTTRERTAAMLQSQLREVGLQVDVVAQEINQLIAQWGTRDYDAIYYAVQPDSADPARNLEFWMSSGSFHFWHPGQAKPATSWEAQLDDLMRRQSTTLDPSARRRLFHDAQAIFAEHLPCLYFAAPKATVAMSARVTGASPSVLQPPILWNAEMLSVSGPAKR